MLALIEFARANGMVQVLLAPSEMSVPLYRSLGFRTAHDLDATRSRTAEHNLCAANGSRHERSSLTMRVE